MEINEYQESDLRRLFSYWRGVGAEIPFFFRVSVQVWQDCLLNGELHGNTLFRTLETYLATESDQVLGFVQYGQPSFAWGESGEPCASPQIGVIRHLYFKANRPDAGEALLTKASDGLAGFPSTYAFYHALGMSCNAHHGKLHSSQSHVEQVLLAHGLQIEHQNAYYVLDLRPAAVEANLRLQLSVSPGAGEKRIELRLDGDVAGTAQVRYLDRLTGGLTRDAVYLS